MWSFQFEHRRQNPGIHKDDMHTFIITKQKVFMKISVQLKAQYGFTLSNRQFLFKFGSNLYLENHCLKGYSRLFWELNHLTRKKCLYTITNHL